MSETLSTATAAWFQAQIDTAAAAGKLTGQSVVHLRTWLNDPRYVAGLQVLRNLIVQQQWAALDAAFWTVIPFGTAGRRGMMFAVGTNAINDRTMGESARGVADYLLELYPQAATARTLRVAIAYDTRHRSRHFAELCAEILSAAGIQTLFLDDHRATPELALTVRACDCQAGIMISASHNPPTDNAIKVFWGDGAQVRPPHDAALIERVNRVADIPRVPFAQALADGRITVVTTAMDQAYRAAVLEQSTTGPRDLNILYTPLHGVGRTSVEPVLRAAGFDNLHVYGPQAAPDGAFTNVPQGVANPENPAIFDELITTAQTAGHELILASDPDADRIGAACPTSCRPGAAWVYLTGNQIGALLGALALQRLRHAGRLTPEHFVVKTLVTGDMLCRLAEHYGCRAIDRVLTGFKWIGAEIDRHGPARFVFGFEEAHGYLAGAHIRDKDAAVAALLLAEYAAELKAAGKTLYQELLRLYTVVGCHRERAFSLTLPGANGMDEMRRLLSRLRSEPPRSLANVPITAVEDYQAGVSRNLVDNTTGEITGPRAELLFLRTGHTALRVAIRPSGTEPKLKFYLFHAAAPADSVDPLAAAEKLDAELRQIETELRAYLAG